MGFENETKDDNKKDFQEKVKYEPFIVSEATPKKACSNCTLLKQGEFVCSTINDINKKYTDKGFSPITDTFYCSFHNRVK